MPSCGICGAPSIKTARYSHRVVTDRLRRKFFRKLLRRLQYIPRAIITDKLGSYAAAKAEVLPDVLHIHDKRANKSR
jgi:hypothetical protein